MSVESLEKLTKEVRELTKTANENKEIIKKGLNRTDFAFNGKKRK